MPHYLLQKKKVKEGRKGGRSEWGGRGREGEREEGKK